MAAAAVYLAAIGTIGIGFLLSPFALAVAILAFRKVAPPRGLLVWSGLVLNAVLTLATVLVVVVFVLGQGAGTAD